MCTSVYPIGCGTNCEEEVNPMGAHYKALSNQLLRKNGQLQDQIERVQGIILITDDPLRSIREIVIEGM